MKVYTDFSLKSLNTFGLNVKARFYTEVHSVSELQEVLQNEDSKGKKKLILGGGSNVLFTQDFEGLVILNRILGIQVNEESDQHVLITAGSGENWHQFVLHTLDLSLGGLENLSLIPGCVGAAPIQNIGAYGVEIKDTFYSLQTVSIIDGTIRSFTKGECQFGYRDSIFKRNQKGKYIITGVTFQLNRNPSLHISYGAISQELEKQHIAKPTIKDVSNAVISIRQSKLPDPKQIGNAGSFFKNPEVENEIVAGLKIKYPDLVSYPVSDHSAKLAAGWLIENCGWKGKRIGNVGMHEKQALVLVNYGNASGEELITHAKRVQESVNEKFGVYLEMEVNIV